MLSILYIDNGSIPVVFFLYLDNHPWVSDGNCFTKSSILISPLRGSPILASSLSTLPIPQLYAAPANVSDWYFLLSCPAESRASCACCTGSSGLYSTPRLAASSFPVSGINWNSPWAPAGDVTRLPSALRCLPPDSTRPTARISNSPVSSDVKLPPSQPIGFATA